jgi:hypothetical protein
MYEIIGMLLMLPQSGVIDSHVVARVLIGAACGRLVRWMVKDRD